VGATAFQWDNKWLILEMIDFNHSLNGCGWSHRVLRPFLSGAQQSPELPLRLGCSGMAL
jgi:hypothetical protein